VKKEAETLRAIICWKWAISLHRGRLTKNFR